MSFMLEFVNPKTTAGNVKVSVEEASIRVPVDKQAVYRAQLFSVTSNLNASATYTTPGYDMYYFTHFQGYVYSDVDGTLHIEISMNGSDWRRLKSISVSGGSTVTFNEEVIARYYRIVYENGATATSTFELVGYKVVK